MADHQYTEELIKVTLTLAEPEASRLRAPQRGMIAPRFLKAVNGYVYEHVHVNDDVYVDLDVPRARGRPFKSQ
jgi:hypothetical protein